MQRTIKNATTFEGIGLHSGQNIQMSVLPAPVDSGIQFIRTDLPVEHQRIDAKFDHVCDTRMNTSISNAFGAKVATIEHLMAAFAGLGISNATVEINASEVPVYDGSSQHFVQALWNSKLVEQERSKKIFKVVKPVSVEGEDGAFAELLPSDRFTIDFEIGFSDSVIGTQHLRLEMANGVFVRELANCRTFVQFSEVQKLQSAGLAKGGSLDNAVVVEGNMVLNPEGFRRHDECVRHKILDALGDLYLLGGSILGEYRGVRAGHTLTNQILRKAHDEQALVEVKSHDFDDIAQRLPGYGLSPQDFAAA